MATPFDCQRLGWPNHDVSPGRLSRGEPRPEASLVDGPAEVDAGAGTALGRFCLVRRLGAGGMGVAHEVLDSEPLTPELRHSNIGASNELLRVEDEAILAAPPSCGGTLRPRLARGPMRVEEVLGLAERLASALLRSHRPGRVRCDIAPGSASSSGDGEAMLLDFGPAKPIEPLAPATTSGEVAVGTRVAAEAERPRFLDRPRRARRPPASFRR
jgi:serine/threonine protein kinase